MDFYNNINLSRNELQNAVAQNLAAAPANPREGLFYYDTGSDRLMYYNGERWVGASDLDTTYTLASGSVNGKIKLTDSAGNMQEAEVRGLAAAAYRGVDTALESGSISTNLPTSAAVAAAIANAVAASDAMVFKGTLGSGGTVTALPSSGVTAGDTYKVVTAGTYANQAAKTGDMFIATARTPAWALIPSGDDGNAYKYTAANPALTASGGICAWTVTHGLGNKYPAVQLYEISTGEMVLADVIAVSASQLKILINSSAGIAAGVYQATIIG